MRQEIAYALIVIMVAAGIAIWWISARTARRRRRTHLRLDLRKKDEQQ